MAITIEHRRKNEAKRRVTQSKADEYSGELKKKMTKAERVIRAKLLHLNVKFQFQKYYFNTEGRIYILDFYLKTHSGRWAIEIDGKHHNEPKQKKYDDRRTQWLLEHRKTGVIRFTNEEALNNTQDCIDKILALSPRFKKPKQ